MKGRLGFAYRRIPTEIPATFIHSRCSHKSIENANKDFYKYLSSGGKEKLFVPHEFEEGYSVTCTIPPQENVDCILMLVHPLDHTGEVDTCVNIAVICIGTGYTIYEKVSASTNIANGHIEKLRIAQQDSYDLESKDYPRYDFIRRKFYSFKTAQSIVAKNLASYFGNKHDPLNEFIYECNARFTCSVCKTTYTAEKCKSCGDNYVCRFCHDHEGNDLTQIEQSLYLNLDEMKKTAVEFCSCTKDKGTFIFSNKDYIHEEIVYAGLPKDLPFLDRDPVLKNSFEKDKIIASVVDIETVNRDPKSFRKIADKFEGNKNL